MKMTLQQVMTMLMLVVGMTSSLFAAETVNDASIKIAWSYKGNNGPERWAQLSPAFAACASGKTQSPIDIPKKITTAATNLTIHYQQAPLAIVEDGTTQLMIGDTQTIIYDGHGTQVNFPENAVNEIINYAGEEYRLIQFHIHSPSENQLQGLSAPLEIHFVHQGKKGKLAVIGVFVMAGGENASLQKIINNIPTDKGKVQMIKGENINPAELMPSILDHYDFLGSLTTPPCTETLQWIVMKQPIMATPGQIAELRNAGGQNARPVQPLNNRAISFSPSQA